MVYDPNPPFQVFIARITLTRSRPSIGMSKFELGRVVTTRSVAVSVDPVVTATLVKRHASGDWGNVCEEDAQANETALAEGERILSIYEASGQKVYVITEADRSHTTVLFASEY